MLDEASHAAHALVHARHESLDGFIQRLRSSTAAVPAMLQRIAQIVTSHGVS